MGITELAVIRWLHILAMVYWLGGEWGVFQTSYNVINRELSLAERRRHMETAYRIDILARTGIIMLLPLGLHMGFLWGIHPFGGGYLVALWVLFALWLSLTWMAFIRRETPAGVRLSIYDERIRFVLIPVLAIAALSSLAGYGPFLEVHGWFSAKLLIYALLLVIGLQLRFIMREWTALFAQLEAPDIEAEARVAAEGTLERSIGTGRKLAYLYWIGIAGVAFLGATKPF
jgi:hypothetical protein